LAIDDTGTVDRRVKDTVRGMYTEASGVEDSGEREEFIRHALASESIGRIYCASTQTFAQGGNDGLAQA